MEAKAKPGKAGSKPKASKPKAAQPKASPEAAPAKPGKESFDPWKVLLYPHLAEKSMGMVEFQNKLTFMVNKKSSKQQIAEAVEKGFDVKVEGVNVEVTMKGEKKAYVKLSPKHSAADIATRLGMI